MHKVLTVAALTTGIAWDESTVTYTDPANSCANMEHSHNSGATELLAHVLKTATGKHAHEYAAERLFTPLGITDTYWQRTPDRSLGHRGRPLPDAARPGEDRLPVPARRVWDGMRLLPEGWVAATAASA